MAPDTRSTKGSENTEENVPVLKNILARLTKLDGLVDDIKEIRSSLQYMSDKYDEVLKDIEQCKKNDVEQRKEINKLRTENAFLNRSVEKANIQLNRLDQYHRRENIEIHGLEMKNNENIPNIIGNLANCLNIPYSTDMVIAAHRLKNNKKSQRPPAIIIRFANRNISEMWIKKKKTGVMSRNIIENGSSSVIYVNENLTPMNKELFWNARVKAKKLKFKYVWVKNGVVFMKRDDASTTIKIEKFDDLPTDCRNSNLEEESN